MPDQRLKNFAKRVLEVLITLLLVLAAFYGVVAIINSLFPTGSSLLGTSLPGGSKMRLRGDVNSKLYVRSGEYEADIMDQAGVAAILHDAVASVKRKPSTGIAWERAGNGTPLYDSDAVQTMRNASASIVFDQDNALRIGENSLVIVKRMERDVFRSEKRTVMVMIDGELSGTLARGSDLALMVEVNTPGAVTRIAGDGASGGAEFRIMVNEDKTSTIMVMSGTAEVVTNGQAVTVQPNQYLTVEDGRAVVAQRTLPPAAAPEAPSHGKNYVYRDLPPVVEFSWKAMQAIGHYHLQIARDADFGDVVVDEKIKATRFTHGNLGAGEYYWRVSAHDGRAEGPFALPRLLSLRRDRDPPRLDIDPLESESTRQKIRIKGRSEAGASIYIDGERLDAGPDGAFGHEITLQRGFNVVVIEAVDEAGNLAYQSHTVFGRFRDD